MLGTLGIELREVTPIKKLDLNASGGQQLRIPCLQRTGVSVKPPHC